MATKKETAPFGSWRSTVSPADVATGGLAFSDLRTDHGNLYWVERRATQRGTGVLVCRDKTGGISDLTGASVSVGTTVHEYGGAPYAVADGKIILSSRTDNSVWFIDGEKPIRKLIDDGRRFADFDIDIERNRAFAVCEVHEGDKVRNSIVLIALDRGKVTTVAQGRDFYSSPRLSPDGKSLCWLAWDLPAMPWEWTELWRADCDGERVDNPRALFAPREESLVQPSWSEAGDLFVMSDRTNFWNLYRVDGTELQPILTIDEECASPAWVFGLTSYALAGDEAIVISTEATRNTVHRINLATLKSTDKQLPLVSFDEAMARDGADLYMVGATSARGKGIHVWNLDAQEDAMIRTSTVASLDDDMRSEASTIRYPREDGTKGYAYLYEPKNAGYSPSKGEKPPLLVRVHGGPTSSCNPGFMLSTQYWTTRGFAVLDVDYAGSSGYGRKERDRLRHGWGVVDVEDCIRAARFVAGQGKAAEDRLLISGGSAGGYMVLCALAFHPGTFAAGADYFGIADMALMQRTTHKFEEGYNEYLLGSTNPEDPIYAERSPLTKISQLTTPLIVFQGLEDAVVPPSQAEVIVEALRQREIPCAAYYFAYEGHGFRDSDNIITTLRAELAFYRHVLEIPSDDNLLLDLGVKDKEELEAPVQ